MNCYYDRNDFMAGHILSKYCQGHTCQGCEKRKKKALVNPD